MNGFRTTAKPITRRKRDILLSVSELRNSNSIASCESVERMHYKTQPLNRFLPFFHPRIREKVFVPFLSLPFLYSEERNFPMNFPSVTTCEFSLRVYEQGNEPKLKGRKVVFELNSCQQRPLFLMSSKKKSFDLLPTS